MVIFLKLYISSEGKKVLKTINIDIKGIAYFQKQPPELFYKKAVVKIFLIFSRKHLSWSLSFSKIAGVRPATLLKKRPQQRCFPVEIVTFLRTPIMKNIWERLFLCFRILKKMRKMKNDKSKAQKNRKSLGKIISSFLISEFFIFSYRQNRKVGFKNLGKKFPRFPSF